MCLFQLASFFFSMCWVYILCEIIVDLLELFGVITWIPSSILGLTVLSWGNSIGDLIASTAISKQGMGEMALTGCIAGCSFNLLLGLGLITLMVNMKIESGKIVMNIHESEGVSSFATLLATVIVLLAITMIAILNDFKIEKKYAKWLLGIYSVSIVLISWVTLS